MDNNQNNEVSQNPLIPNDNDNNQQQNDSNDVLFGVMSYIGFLSLIVLYLIKPKSDFAIFHAKQGANLFIIELIVNVIGGGARFALNTAHVPFAGTIISLASTAIWILSIIGIIYACQGKKEELPIISKGKIIK